MVVIFGKDACPYTQSARDHYAAQGEPFEYVNVKKNPAQLERARRVPVIVDGDSVTIGFGGT